MVGLVYHTGLHLEMCSRGDKIRIFKDVRRGMNVHIHSMTVIAEKQRGEILVRGANDLGVCVHFHRGSSTS